MPLITGTLTDIGGGHLAGKQPRIIFELDGPVASGTNLVATEPVSVVPAFDGKWSVNLLQTTSMNSSAHYRLSIEWLDSANNYVRIDYPDWRIQVPAGGGSIGDLVVGGVTNPKVVYVSLTPPKNPVPFMLWLEVDPGNSTNPRNTGNLYEWSNA